MKIDEIIRTNRRSFGLEVKPDGRLIVRAPKSASDAQVKAVVNKKAGWIEKTRIRVTRNYPHLKPKTFTRTLPG